MEERMTKQKTETQWKKEQEDTQKHYCDLLRTDLQYTGNIDLEKFNQFEIGQHLDISLLNRGVRQDKDRLSFFLLKKKKHDVIEELLRDVHKLEAAYYTRFHSDLFGARPYPKEKGHFSQDFTITVYLPGTLPNIAVDLSQIENQLTHQYQTQAMQHLTELQDIIEKTIKPLIELMEVHMKKYCSKICHDC